MTGADLDRHYTGLAFWYHIPPWELTNAPAVWVRKLAKYLPYHRDQYFLALQMAAHGQYKPHAEAPKQSSPEPSTIRAAANRALDAFSSRADAAIQAYRARRGR